MTKRLRVFLTGASGFIGSYVARQLVKENCQILALLRSPSAKHSVRLKDIQNKIKFIEGDLSQATQLQTGLKRFAPDICIHLAWYTESGKCLESLINLECLMGSVKLLTILNKINCPRFIIAGTGVEYDTDTGYLSEQSPINPRNLYAASKQSLALIAEQLVKMWGATLALPRIFYVYGPHEEESRLVPFVIRHLLAGKECRLTSGEQIRDYLHVEDVASAICRISLSNIEGAVNIGSSQPIAVRAIAEEIARQTKQANLLKFGTLPSRPGDPPFVCANTTRLQEELGWKPFYTIDSGLHQTIEWWKAQASHSKMIAVQP